MILLEGKTPAGLLREELRSRAAALAATGHASCLAAVLVGGDKASDLYLRRKAKLGRELGITVEEHRIPSASETELASLLRELGQRPDVDGILVEQPLPRSVRKEKVLAAIEWAKDVDGRTPATPKAVMRLLRHYGIRLAGAHVVIVGHSDVVGKPLAMLMLHADATVTVCHKLTRDLVTHTRQADIVVVAAGVPGLIRGDMIRPGATVVDVGINVVDGKTVGDVDFESVSAVAGALTPVPGGVGPLTTLTILENTVDNAERHFMTADCAAD
ncbi:MAG TPA: bifunctional 5,10-methylenetetrahydrofolate dehydrogenase/5,10-methenyltetrahydrofolate cyclohydrolase [Symbiobacteriaceae bacterium]